MRNIIKRVQNTFKNKILRGSFAGRHILLTGEKYKLPIFITENNMKGQMSLWLRNVDSDRHIK